jgi:hypothetical protein
VTEQLEDDRSIGAFINRLKTSGESAFNKLSEQLLENPAFMSAFRRAVEAKGQVDKTVSGTMDFMNLPSKNDVQRVLEELTSVSAQLASARQRRQCLAADGRSHQPDGGDRRAHAGRAGLGGSRS